MAVTPETLTRHELVGLDVRVASASNPDLVGLEGEVVMETTRTLGIETGGRVSHVPKDSATFEWTLPSGEVVETAGETLLARPARRTEHKGDSKWE
ncbi:ribonuclease P [Halobacteriales archaeon QH_2_65_14]|nr:MAG: ribonuclease P [Halobacteriales archaeon QH_2_65_14]